MAGELPRKARKHEHAKFSLANPDFFHSVHWAGPSVSQHLSSYSLSSEDAGIPATVSVVGELSPKHYRLFLGGNWSALSADAITDVTSTALLQRPRHVIFRDMWDTVIANIHAICESAVGNDAHVNAAVQSVIDWTSCSSGPSLQMGHRFFRKKEHADDGEDEFPNVAMIGQAELPADKLMAYELNGWPRKTGAIAKATLNAVRRDDLNFKHTSTPFSAQGPAAHAFTAEIVEMRILQEARYNRYTSRVSYLGPWDDADDEAY
ncbi:hypothetical protein FA95DRAFT_1567543 [Auriscalpium vulgare]|uniref:Uncharacterized protein n=1 Tax=Auriscalpium vulgare TaxID=40419 RepID=A0ACB8R3X4_9AGAM|nr:hypothetical protein FA95DRAFT_1567543 [Auriscalpium vulgare]